MFIGECLCELCQSENLGVHPHNSGAGSRNSRQIRNTPFPATHSPWRIVSSLSIMAFQSSPRTGHIGIPELIESQQADLRTTALPCPIRSF